MVFDPKQHLQIVPPTAIKTMAFNTIPFPYKAEDAEDFPGIAYTMPFRLLSDEGVRSLRHVVDDNMDLARQNDRNHSLRGLGYRSQWIRDMSFCPEIVDLVSQLAREELWPHDVLMHLAHTNLGKVGSGKAVDEW
jgi:hypothetical protein